MKYKGVAFDLYHKDGISRWSDDLPAVVAILTPTKLSIDYKEPDGTPMHVEATSSDGVTYLGSWGYPHLDPNHPVELQRFESKKHNEVLFIGPWESKNSARQGVYIFRLTPSD